MRPQLVLCIKYKYCFSPKLNFPNKKVGVIIDEGVLSVRNMWKNTIVIVIIQNEHNC